MSAPTTSDCNQDAALVPARVATLEVVPGNHPVNDEKVAPYAKKLGGVTGKGFLPGKSGNPKGGSIPQKAKNFFGETVRKWLLKRDWLRDAEGNRIKGAKELRINTVIKRLAYQKPEILLHYAYGKPAEMVEISQAEGAPIEFVVKVARLREEEENEPSCPTE